MRSAPPTPPAPCRVVGELGRRAARSRALGPGEAIVIATGGGGARGADAVVPIEWTRQARVDAPARRRRGTTSGRAAGTSAEGARSWRPPAVLRPAQAGALAAAGVGDRSVRPPPARRRARDRHRAPPARPAPRARGDLRVQHGRCSRAARCRRARTRRSSESVGDDEDATRDALERGLEGDLLVTSGGVSVGPHDLVRASLASLDAEEVFWRRCGQARQADRVRRCAAARSSSVCRGTRSRHSSTSSCSCGPPCSRCRAPLTRGRRSRHQLAGHPGHRRAVAGSEPSAAKPAEVSRFVWLEPLVSAWSCGSAAAGTSWLAARHVAAPQLESLAVSL